ncbi:MAG TPA: LysR family transcriptional regulator [Paucimonas sp.]|nr:LysR family transcriptional regulator [Paucimonas sp.]HJW57292.1 LysR family transcriptional regulator [Burkholderiaceae bacterium]
MSFLTLDLNLLRVFDAIMTEQNLTRAANRLAMTQPAVSNALRRLRDALSDELLIRTAHGVKPTPRAEELWPVVRNALSSLEEAVAPTSFDISKVHATFRMAMADATAVLWLPALVRSIESEASGVNVRMVPLTTREPRPMLLRGDIDLAIGFFPGVVAQLAGGPDTPIRHERMYSGQYVCVMRKEHPLAKKELTLDAYCAANHLLVSFSGRAHGLTDEALAQLNRERRILLTVNQFFTAGRVVANSDLITVLPRHLIASTGMTGSLIAKELPFKLPNVHVDMLWHERDARSPAHRWLREHLSSMTGDAMERARVLA